MKTVSSPRRRFPVRPFALAAAIGLFCLGTAGATAAPGDPVYYFGAQAHFGQGWTWVSCHASPPGASPTCATNSTGRLSNRPRGLSPSRRTTTTT